MNAAVALALVAVVVAATIAVGLRGVRGVKMSAGEYIVGGRSLGALLLWLLLAGEIYTTFTFLGAAGWAYGKGAPAYYILAYGTLAYIISYFLAPPLHRIARERKMLTGPDYFTDRYGSRWLGGLVALLGFVMLVPYATLQLSGVQILLRVAGYGAIDPFVAVAVAFALIAVFTYLTGLRGAAWASVVKDALVLAGVIFAGVVLPIRFFGSPAGALDAVLRDHPGWLTFAGPLAPNGITWVMSTVVLTSLGFFMWPQAMAAIYSARDEDTLRRNAIFLPFYQVMLLLVFFAGFAALEIVPGLKGAAADQSFMLVVQKYYPAWVLGLVAAAGVLAGLVPASVQILAAASIVAKNVFADNGIARDDAAQTRLTRDPGAGRRAARVRLLGAGQDDAGRPAADRLQRHHAAVPRRGARPGAAPAARARGRRGHRRRSGRADLVHLDRNVASRRRQHRPDRAGAQRRGARPRERRLLVQDGPGARVERALQPPVRRRRHRVALPGQRVGAAREVDQARAAGGVGVGAALVELRQQRPRSGCPRRWRSAWAPGSRCTGAGRAGW